jgi:sigma-E factor negative regulatory protein RseA
MTQQAIPGPKRDDCSEALSRLIDGELDSGGCRELFARLERDADARRAWVLLNVACDAVRSSETAALHSTAFVSRVSAALDAEPVILAPGAVRRRQVFLRRVGIPAAAVAAAVVVLAVVAVPQLRGTDAAPDQVVKNSPAKAERPVPPRDTEVVRSDELEAYLTAHREGAAGPVTSRSSDFIVPAAATSTESR